MSIPFYESKHGYEYDYAVSFYNGGTGFPPHMHRCFEVLIGLDGELKVTVDGAGYLLCKNDLIMIKPYQIHEIEITAPYTSYYVYLFSPELVPAVSGDFVSHGFISPEIKSVKTLPDILLSEIGGENIAIKKGVLYTLCGMFYENVDFSEKTPHEKDRTLLQKIFGFVENNMDTPCAIVDLAKDVGRAPAYLSRLFSSAVGMTYGDYVRKVKVNRACSYLANTDDGVLNIALRCGYNSLTSFNRAFKSVTGENPTEYRRKSRAGK